MRRPTCCLSSNDVRDSLGIEQRGAMFQGAYPEEDLMRFKNLTDHLISISLAAGLAACAGSQAKPDAQANKEEKPAAVAESAKPANAPDSNIAQGQAELE